MINYIHDMNLRTLDLNLLRVLDALLAERNVTRAAARLHLSQPALSNALARLRRAFDDPLLVRTPRGMVPTPRAAALAGPVHRALAGLEEALDDRRFDPATSDQVFRLAATDYMEFVVFPPLIRRLRAIGSRIALHVAPLGETAKAEALARGDVDLALGYFRRPDENLHARALFEERFVCLVRRDHPAARRRLTLKQFVALDHVLVAPSGVARGVVDEQLERRGLARRVALAIPHFLQVPFIVAETDYIATLAERVAQRFVTLLPLKVLPPPLEVPGFTVSMLWHARTQHSPAHRWLREQLVEIAGRA
jgi:DNA-binding transcriptional LysR family regulator